MSARTGPAPDQEAKLREHIARRRHEAYTSFFAPVTDRFLPALLDAVPRVDPRSARRALDLGCGPGELATRLRRVGWNVLALDHDPLMAARARRAGCSVLVADAARLPLATDAVDVAAAAFLLPHVEDVVEHLVEVRRVLRPGGSMVQLGWAGTEASPFTGLAMDVLARRAETQVLLHVEEARRRADHRLLAEAVVRAGFVDIEVETARLDVPVSDARVWWRGMLVASTGLSVLLQMLAPERRREVEQDFVALATSFASGDGLVVPAAALLIRATA